MFFKLHNDTKLQVKFASYAKIPYAGNILNVFRTSYKPYSNLIGTIHCVKKEDYTTYFYSKNNAIKYYRKDRNDTIMPIVSFFEPITSQVIKLQGKHDIDEENSLLVRTEDGKYYVVAISEDIIVLNVSDNKIIYSAPVSNTLYSGYFYPIANVIVPIMQVTPSGINITLCNLLNNKTHTISLDAKYIGKVLTKLAVDKELEMLKSELGTTPFGLEFIKKLVVGLADIADIRYEFNEIHKFSLDKIHYMYDASEHGLSYIKGIKIAVIVDSIFMDIKIELSGENIICCLDRQDEWYRRRGYNRSYNNCSEAPNFFVKKYSFDGKVRNNYLSNFFIVTTAII